MRQYGIIIVLALIYCLPFGLKSQIRLGGLFTTEQRFIRNATDSALFILRQDYTLRNVKDPESSDYGLGGNPYFGRAYYLAVWSGDQLWLSADVLSPWQQDSNFAPYEGNDSIQPILSHSFIRPLTEPVFTPLDSNSQAQMHAFPENIQGVISLDYETIRTSLPLIRETKDPGGWGIYVFTKKPLLENDTCTLSYRIYKLKPDFEDALMPGKIAPPKVDGVLAGGVYVNEGFSIGLIRLSFAGLAQTSDSNWVVQSVPALIEESPELSVPEPEMEEYMVRIRLIHAKEKFPLAGQVLSDHESGMTYTTNENGEVEIMFPDSALTAGIQLYLNGLEAICFNAAGDYELGCKYEASTGFIPKKPLSLCN